MARLKTWDALKCSMLFASQQCKQNLESLHHVNLRKVSQQPMSGYFCHLSAIPLLLNLFLAAMAGAKFFLVCNAC